MSDPKPPLIVIHMARKPLEGTVAENALKHGTGSLNIGASRVRPGHSHKECASGGVTGWGSSKMHADPHTQGRWPANIILSHLPECRLTGAVKIPGHKGYPNGPGGKSFQYSSDKRGAEVRPNAWAGHADADGNEMVDEWACADGCPVADLDEQSGVQKSGVATQRNGGGQRIGSGIIYGGSKGLTRPDTGFGDSGGASRYFKQIGGSGDE